MTTLINGIETAFFTSIAGVILSILFNILYRILWNDLNREYGLFLDCFHKQVVPPTDVQMRQAFQNGLRELFLRLDRLPQDPGYSPVHGIRTPFLNEASEKLLMPQIVQAMEEGQFLFYLQPVVTLKTRKLVGIEALVRWQHDSLGLLTPSAFLPVLEQNAYITKLDLAIWDLACKTIRGWLDSGFRPLPMTLNVSKADFLALDLPAVFAGLLKEYKLPPRSLELDVPANVYSGDSAVIPQVLAQLRGMGLKVTLDNFNGDYLAFQDVSHLEVDSMKLDLRFLTLPESDAILEDCFLRSRELGIELTASGIESAAQVVKLESLGCSAGQGFYFYSPMPAQEYLRLAGRQDLRL